MIEGLRVINKLYLIIFLNRIIKQVNIKLIYNYEEYIIKNIYI